MVSTRRGEAKRGEERRGEARRGEVRKKKKKSISSDDWTAGPWHFPGQLPSLFHSIELPRQKSLARSKAVPWTKRATAIAIRYAVPPTTLVVSYILRTESRFLGGDSTDLETPVSCHLPPSRVRRVKWKQPLETARSISLSLSLACPFAQEKFSA